MSPDKQDSKESRTSPRRVNSPGRRRTDNDPRVEFSRKFLVVAVTVINAVYLASEAILSTGSVC